MTVQVVGVKEEDPLWEYWQDVMEEELMRKWVEKTKTGYEPAGRVVEVKVALMVYAAWARVLSGLGLITSALSPRQRRQIVVSRSRGSCSYI